MSKNEMRELIKNILSVKGLSYKKSHYMETSSGAYLVYYMVFHVNFILDNFHKQHLTQKLNSAAKRIIEEKIGMPVTISINFDVTCSNLVNHDVVDAEDLVNHEDVCNEYILIKIRVDRTKYENQLYRYKDIYKLNEEKNEENVFSIKKFSTFAKED